MTEFFVGTSGFSYKEWKGKFYPSDIKPGAMLEYYAERFNAVEINNTFYRMPRRDLLQRWAAAVPDHFRFIIKAPRRITHQKKLVDVDEEVRFLVRNTAAMGERLGGLLFQLPPWVRKDVDLLADLLEQLPTSHPVALEFRHRSWQDDEINELLGDRGATRVVADTEEKPAKGPWAGGNWGYLRLRQCAYEDTELTAWRARIAERGWDRCMVFFKHEDEGTGPELAARFNAA